MVTRRLRNANHIGLLCALGTAGFAASAALASGTPAGIVIENTAEASFETGGVAASATSNTVQVRVDELLDAAAVSLDAGAVPVETDAAVLTFRISNVGNGPEAFTLSADPAVPGNDFDATIEGIAVDTNGNGVYDAGVDPLLPQPETSPVLNADDDLTVFVVASAPAGQADGARSQINLVMQSVTGTGAPGTVFAGQGANGSDAVVGPNGASATASGELVQRAATVSLTKSANVVDPFGGNSAVPGAIIQFLIEANASGSVPINNLVITDAIPANTGYVANSLTLDGVGLSDASGDDAGDADATGISVALGTVSPPASHLISFSVIINE